MDIHLKLKFNNFPWNDNFSCPTGYRGDALHQCSFDPVRAKRKIKEEDEQEDKEVELPSKEE